MLIEHVAEGEYEKTGGEKLKGTREKKGHEKSKLADWPIARKYLAIWYICIGPKAHIKR